VLTDSDPDCCKAASDLLLNRHSIYIQPINYPTVPIGTGRLRIAPTPRHSEAHVSSLVEALVDVWKTLGLPFTAAQIVPLHRRKPLPECVYPKIRKAVE
jgi:5-aminolevulinate synthase